jgi:hypothetical protein
MNLTVISDIHGCYFTLIRLLNKCAEGEVFLAGDLIDRGPHSKEVVEFAMANKIPTTMGNHCDLALAYSEHAKLGYKSHCRDFYSENIWLANGGIDCLVSYGANELPRNVLDWMQQMPAYFIRDGLLISHTGYGLDENWLQKLWGRHGYQGGGAFPDDGLYRVFGHTQQKEAVITDKWAMIDTGAAYGGRGMGTLTAFEWPTKKIIGQKFDETPVEPNFTIVDGHLIRESKNNS